MTILEWDQVGDRRFETGIDRGVLYLLDGRVLPWNGLTSITENREREVKSYYIDGIKYLDHYVPGSYSAKLQAFTYPDELEELLGVAKFAPGVYVHDQKAGLFHLSYRTRVGNDVAGVDYGYKIHVVYNIMAIPSSFAYDTLSDSIDPKPFEWSLTGTAQNMFGVRPTNHISFDSRSIDSDMLEDIEKVLYGSSSESPTLPTTIDFLAAIESGSIGGSAS